MEVMTCLTCRVAFSELSHGRQHYQSDWHRYNTKRKVAHMDPISNEAFKTQMEAKQQVSKDKAEDGFCRLCNKVFHSQNALDSHLRSRKHKEMAGLAEKHGIDKSRIVTRSTSRSSEGPPEEVHSEEDEDMEVEEVDSWDEDEDDEDGEGFGQEECLFCSHVSPSLEDNLQHMTVKHSFFLPDAEFIADLEGLVGLLGEIITRGHRCLWCQDKVRKFRSAGAVQKHMVDKGHCKVHYDCSTRNDFQLAIEDCYDYRKTYPDVDKANEDEDPLDPELLISNGFELVLPSGSTVGHRSLACYYKQNYGRRHVVKAKTPLSKVLANYKALGWTGNTGVAVKQRARDIVYLQRMKQKYHMKLGTKANSMQHHFRAQNPI